MGFIYCITDKKTLKRYIGQTIKSPQIRFKEHKFRQVYRYFTNSLHKRPNDFYIEWYSKFPIEELSYWETYMISLCGTLYPNGYNMTIGGERTYGYKHSIEIREKISRILKGKKRPKLSQALKGRKLSFEHCQKISIAGKGRKATNETKLKMSISFRGRIFTNEHKKNISLAAINREKKRRILLNKIEKVSKYSIETLEKMRIANTGKKHSDETKEKCRLAAEKYWNSRRQNSNKQIISNDITQTSTLSPDNTRTKMNNNPNDIKKIQPGSSGHNE